jgi:hypothetical protein
VILKLRIWPLVSGSVFADAAGAVIYQRAFSIDPKLDKSSLEGGVDLEDGVNSIWTLRAVILRQACVTPFSFPC